jgi:hypothetical protein
VPEQVTKGKRGKLYVFRELRRRGVVPYVPFVDMQAVDAVMRGAGGTYLELQIKTVATSKDPRWFQVQNLRPRHGYFIVCVALATEPIETWIIPSFAFKSHATCSRKTRLYDLNLDSTARAKDVPRWKILEEYKDAWHLLVEGVETYEAREAEALAAVSDASFGQDWASSEDAVYDAE